MVNSKEPSTTEARFIPASALPHRTPAELLVLARRGLDDAQIRGDGLRYAAAHLAALRAAAALLAARAKPAPGRSRGRVASVWSLLPQVAPEFDEWTTFFAGRSAKRAAAEAGILWAVSPADADEMMRAAEQFVALVETAAKES